VLAGVVAGCLFERVVLTGMQAVMSTPVTAPQVATSVFALSGPGYNVAQILSNTQGWSALALMLLLFAVLLRLVTRRLWAADLLGSLVFSVFLGGLVILGTEPRQSLAGFILFWLVCLVWMRMLRHFGFLAVLVVFSMGLTRFIPPVYTGWLASQSVTLQLIPIALAAAALWVIVSAESQPQLNRS
jgi:hypothetical protein